MTDSFLKINGEIQLCEICECRLFRQIDEENKTMFRKYKCNSCGEVYIGEMSGRVKSSHKGETR